MKFTATARSLGIFSATATVILVVAYAVTLAGLSGVVVGDMQLRNIGIVGYVGVFPVVATLLAVLFYRATPLGA